jgi:hypothetical protein
MVKTCKQSAAVVVIAAFGLFATACSSLEVSDYCRHSEERSIREAYPESLGLVLGLEARQAMETPFVIVRSLSEKNPGASLTLHATPAAHPIPVSLDESRCARIDWGTYTLTVDPDEWNAFWQDDRNARFEIAIAFLGDSRPLLVSSFGAAIVDTAAAEALVSCGCYWN